MNPLNHHFDRSRFSRSIGLRTSRATRKKLGDPAIARCFGLGGHGRRLDGRSPSFAPSPAVFSFARTLILYRRLRRRRRLGRSGSASRRWADPLPRSPPSLPRSSRMQPRCKKRGRWHADVSRGKEGGRPSSEWVGNGGHVMTNPPLS